MSKAATKEQNENILEPFAFLSELDPNTLMDTNRASREITKVTGREYSPNTMATQRTRGGGAPYRKFGRTVLYRWGDVLGWIESRLSPPRFSSSEIAHEQPPRHNTEAEIVAHEQRMRAADRASADPSLRARKM